MGLSNTYWHYDFGRYYMAPYKERPSIWHPSPYPLDTSCLLPLENNPIRKGARKSSVKQLPLQQSPHGLGRPHFCNYPHLLTF